MLYSVNNIFQHQIIIFCENKNNQHQCHVNVSHSALHHSSYRQIQIGNAPLYVCMYMQEKKLNERGDDYKSFSYINQRPQKEKTNIINTKKITFFFENIILNSKKIYKKNTKIIFKYPKISH